MKTKVSVALVTHDMVPAGFMYDFASLMMFTAATLPEDVELGINMVAGTYVHAGREMMLKGDGEKPGLLEQGVTHILWIDTDMRFPKDALARLWKHNVDMVGINYSTRGSPSNFVAIKEVGNDEKIGHKLETLETSEGIEEVDAIGFGMVLMKTKSLVNMPLDQRWFWFDFMPKRKQMVGEDVYFCNLYRKHGGRIFVDHDLSKACAHIGQYEYALEDVWATKEVMQTGPKRVAAV